MEGEGELPSAGSVPKAASWKLKPDLPCECQEPNYLSIAVMSYELH